MTPRSVLIDNDVETPLPDGTVLRSTVYRPADGVPCPVLLTRTPYGRDLAVNSAYLNPATVAAAGYVVILQDCRGRFGSGGTFDPSVNEASDGASTVEWAARLPYSNGVVGMWGRSYFAETQWRAASCKPAGLEALSLGVSAGANANNGSLYRGGAFELGSRLTWGHASISANELLREFADDAELRTKELESWLDLDRSFSDATAFGTLPLQDLSPRLATFMRRHVLPSAGETPGSSFARIWDDASAVPVDMPTLHIGGWFDIFAPSTLAQYRMQLEHSRANPAAAPRLIVGPWTHTNFSGVYPDVSFGLNAAAGVMNGLGDLSGIQTAWFDSVLKGNPDRLRQVPPVLLYFMGENQWRGFDELPVPSRERSWFLGSGGTLGDAPGLPGQDSYDYDPLDPVPTAGGATMIHGAVPAGPAVPAGRRGARRRPDVHNGAVRRAGDHLRRSQRHVLRRVFRRRHRLRGAPLPGHSGRNVAGPGRRDHPCLLAGQLCGHGAVGTRPRTVASRTRPAIRIHREPVADGLHLCARRTAPCPDHVQLPSRAGTGTSTPASLPLIPPKQWWPRRPYFSDRATPAG